MTDTDKPIRRKATIPETSLEVTVSHDGDVYLVVKGKNIIGEPQEVQVEFTTLAGGGYNPKTLEALYALAEAMEQDNQDPESVRRYGPQ